jgi:hypothetical protein
MPSPIKVSLGAFEVDLAELVEVIHDLTSVKLDQGTKDALQLLITEARKSFDAVVDALAPLYALNTRAKVRDDFPGLYAKFKGAYLKNPNEVRTHCHIVSDQIEKLKAGQAWKQNIPLLRNAFDRLVTSQMKWVGNDDALADSMSRFLKAVNDELGSVLEKLQPNPDSAYAELSALLADAEPELLRIKTQLDRLKIASSQLLGV